MGKKRDTFDFFRSFSSFNRHVRVNNDVEVSAKSIAE